MAARICLAFLIFTILIAPGTAGDKGNNKMTGIYQFKLKDISGKEVDFARYKGKVLLIVNVASECGYTPQYKGLQALHSKYAKEGLAVLGIPCNDFGAQEPGTEAQIAAFCKKNYDVKFELFSKVAIEGKNATPLYKYLTSKETNPRHGGPVRWNFEKFLVSREGNVVARYLSEVEPESDEVIKAIKTELAKKVP